MTRDQVDGHEAEQREELLSLSAASSDDVEAADAEQTYITYPYIWSTHRDTTLVKPEEIKIIGLLFYGRKRSLEILDCYLQKNLVSNGGFLDEIRFIRGTDDIDDIVWVSQKVREVDGYTLIRSDANEYGDYHAMWMHTQAGDEGQIYVKIDDDLAWMSDLAIPQIVSTLLDHPEALAVLPNLINSASLGFMNFHAGAVNAYLPEVQRPPQNVSDASYGPTAWRSSALPTWKSASKLSISEVIEERGDGGPYKNHRWLPLRENNKTHLQDTPIQDTVFEIPTTDWKSKFDFGDSDGIWNPMYKRMNINLIAIRVNDLLDNYSGGGDEHELTITIPKRLSRPVLIQTKAMAAHYAFQVQPKMHNTDALARYRAYANEMICPADKQIPLDEFGTAEPGA